MIILISWSYQGQSQNTINPGDTICKPIPELRLIYKDARLYRYTDSLLKISELQVTQLQNSIKLLNERGVELKVMYDGQLSNLNQQISLYKDQINGYEKLLKRERFRRRLITAGGIAATGAIFYLYLTK